MSVFKYSSLGQDRPSAINKPSTLARQTGHPAYYNGANLFDSANYEISSDASSTMIVDQSASLMHGQDHINVNDLKELV